MHGALGQAALGADAGEGCDDAVEHGARGEVLLPGLAGEAAAGFALGEAGLEDGGELFNVALGDAEEEGVPGGPSGRSRLSERTTGATPICMASKRRSPPALAPRGQRAKWLAAMVSAYCFWRASRPFWVGSQW
jgi:hypothetical protein